MARSLISALYCSTESEEDLHGLDNPTELIQDVEGTHTENPLMNSQEDLFASDSSDNCDIKGEDVITECERCGDYVAVPIEGINIFSKTHLMVSHLKLI